MAKYPKNGNTDGDETVFFQAAKADKTTNAYDTQQLDAAQIRRRAAQTGYTGYNGTDPYGDYGQSQNGYVNRGQYQNGYANQGQSQNGYANQGQYQNGYANYGYDPNGYQNRQYQSEQNAYRSNGNGSAAQHQRSTSAHSQAARQPRNNFGNNNGTYRQASASRQSNPNHSRSNSTRQAEQHSGVRKKSKRNKNSHSLLFRIIRLLCILILVVFLLYSAVAMIGIFSMNRVSTGARSVTSGSLSESYVKNVLIIGTDTRDPETDQGRSDSMILVSVNSNTNNVYMTSFMRDAYVEIPGYGSGKLNAAYSYGGAELLLDTIEYNYDLRIDNYVLFTFEACADVIDAVGGLEIEITDEEAEAINEILISEVNEIMGDDAYDDLLDGGGTLQLNGKQALSYSRIRYVGNADFERTERQRNVMQLVMEKAMANPLRLAKICIMALPELTTNMSVGSLYSYALITPVQLVVYDLEQLRLPSDDMYTNATINGESVLEVDFEAAKQLLEETVFA